jgi:hypothetical protein
MKLHSTIRQRCEVLFIASIVVLSGCVVDEDPTKMQKEITVDGGSISIIDEHNNTIEVIFPKDALDKTTQIYVGVLSEQPELPIETQHVSAFEIKPYDTELYYPITVRVTYNNVIQDINRTALFRKKADILVPLADRNFGTGSKSIEAETFSLGVFAEGKMSLEQINTQIGLIFASYGINWDQENATMFGSFLSDYFLTLWADYREAAKGELEYMTIKQYLGFDTSDDMYFICFAIVEPGIDKLLLEDKPANPCDRTYAYTVLDALALLQQLGCNWENRPIYDRFEEVMNCACFTFGSPDKVNLVSINAVGDGVSITLYGNETFSASSNLGSTSGSWKYTDVGIWLYPVQDEDELEGARLSMLRNQVCINDTMTLTTPAWYDEEDEYHPPQFYELTVVNVIITH